MLVSGRQTVRDAKSSERKRHARSHSRVSEGLDSGPIELCKSACMLSTTFRNHSQKTLATPLTSEAVLKCTREAPHVWPGWLLQKFQSSDKARISFNARKGRTRLRHFHCPRPELEPSFELRLARPLLRSCPCSDYLHLSCHHTDTMPNQSQTLRIAKEIQMAN